VVGPEDWPAGSSADGHGGQQVVDRPQEVAEGEGFGEVGGGLGIQEPVDVALGRLGAHDDDRDVAEDDQLAGIDG
jgi:hypothetical protein